MTLAASGADAGTVLLELGLVLLGLAVLGRGAARFGLSPIPLYLLAGLALGDGGVVELVTSSDFIEVGAEIGLVLLLLLLGLEYTPDELVGGLRSSAPAGAVDFLLNFTPGALAGLLLGWSTPAVITLGGITYISSSGIIAKVLADLGRLGNRETPVILSILVIEDLVMALYLPLLAGLLVGGSVATTALQFGVAVTIVVVLLLVALKWGEHVSRVVFVHSDELLLLSILGLTFVVAGAAEKVQVSAAVGAFLVGILLSGKAAERAKPLLSPLRHFFAAAFFVFFGLEIDPASLPDAALAAAALAAVGAVTKFVTGWWAARRAGVARAGRTRAGTALVARGEFSIVIAGLAVAAGVEDEVGPLAAAYVLILAVAGPILARVADSLARVGAGRTTPRTA